MTPRKLVCLAIMLLALLSRTAAAQQEPRFAAEGWYWKGAFEASAQVGDGTLGTVFDFKKDLGMSDQSIPEGRLVWQSGPHSRWRFAGLKASYSGDATVTRTIEFNGATYTVGTRVLSGLDTQYLRLGWTWLFAGTSDDSFRVGVVLEVKSLTFDARLQAPETDPPIVESDRKSVVLPTAGLAIDVKPHRAVNVFLEGSGIDAGSRGSMVDAEAGVRVFLTPNFGLIAAYRIVELRVNDARDYAKLRITGPLMALSLRW